MSNYATIEYPEINLIMNLSNNCSLFPLTAIKNIKNISLSSSGYTRGICEIENNVSVILNFAEFLSIIPPTDQSEQILLKITDKNGDFGLIIP